MDTVVFTGGITSAYPGSVGETVPRASQPASVAGVARTYYVAVGSTRSAGGHFRAPALVALSGQVAPGWEITRLLPVRLQDDEDGTYVASDRIFLVHGVGDTPTEALEDYIESLIEYYELLMDRSDEAPTRAILSHLKSYLRPLGERKPIYATQSA